MAWKRRYFLWASALLATVATCAFASSASASQLIDRNATDVSLKVNSRGEALVTYRVGGKLKHVLAWGATNAIAPTTSRAQVAFSVDYAGGWGKYKQDYWKTFANACHADSGVHLAWQVAVCTAPDGSHWALQAWQRALPNFGLKPTAAQSVWELRLSHWTGPLPELNIKVNWAYRHFDHLYGTFTYNGSSVFGFRSSSSGAPLDSFGRNVYVDTYDSAYGAGWRRENSFLTHTSTGAFCYGFFQHGSHPIGKGQRYRATVEGPGVTPDVMWEGSAPGAFDPAAQAAANDEIRALGDGLCHPV